MIKEQQQSIGMDRVGEVASLPIPLHPLAAGFSQLPSLRSSGLLKDETFEAIIMLILIARKFCRQYKIITEDTRDIRSQDFISDLKSFMIQDTLQISEEKRGSACHSGGGKKNQIQLPPLNN